MSGPEPYVLDMKGGVFTLGALDRILSAMREGREVTIRHCTGTTTLEMGMPLMAMYDKARKA